MPGKPAIRGPRERDAGFREDAERKDGTVTREEEIERRLAGAVVPWSEKDVIRFIEETDSDLRYLLDKVKLLEGNAAFAFEMGRIAGGLHFVGPDEAAKWPEGTMFLAMQSDGKRRMARTSMNVDDAVLFGYTHFARLPETLPELEGK
jgi:hypothetical protein